MGPATQGCPLHCFCAISGFTAFTGIYVLSWCLLSGCISHKYIGAILPQEGDVDHITRAFDT